MPKLIDEIQAERVYRYRPIIVDVDIHRRAKAAAALAGKSLKEVVEKALEEFIEEQKTEVSTETK